MSEKIDTVRDGPWVTWVVGRGGLCGLGGSDGLPHVLGYDVTVMSQLGMLGLDEF